MSKTYGRVSHQGATHRTRDVWPWKSIKVCPLNTYVSGRGSDSRRRRMMSSSFIVVDSRCEHMRRGSEEGKGAQQASRGPTRNKPWHSRTVPTHRHDFGAAKHGDRKWVMSAG